VNSGVVDLEQFPFEEKRHNGLCDCAAYGFYPEEGLPQFHIYFYTDSNI